MAKLIVPVESHFPAKVTTKGRGVMTKINDKFNEHGLIKKAEDSPFGQFFKAPAIQFSGTLLHQLLLRKVAAKNPQELVFNIGGKTLKFGIREFALITGLNFGPDPEEEQWHALLQNRRLQEVYFNDKKALMAGELELGFLNCNEVDDVWKLGLCYLVSGLLMSSEPNRFIFEGLLSLADNEDAFFNYPWGRHVYYKTFNGVNKDMLHYQEIYSANLKAGKRHPEAKYTVYGFHAALLYWAFEAIPMMDTICGQNVGIHFPRMLSWTSNSSPTTQQLSDLFQRVGQTLYATLQPRRDEKDFLDAFEQQDADEDSLEAGSESKNLHSADINIGVDRELSEETPQETKGGAPVVSEQEHEHVRTSDFQKLCSDVAEMKAKQLVLEMKMDTIIELLKQKATPPPSAAEEKTPPLSPHLAHTVTPSPPPAVAIPPQSPPPAVAIPPQSPPPAPTTVSEAPASTPVKIMDAADVEHIPFERRKRPSKLLEDYTDPAGKKFKLADPCKPNPFRPFEKEELLQFNKWLSGLVHGPDFIDVGVGDGNKNWFFTLKSRGEWLDDKHLDAACNLLRERTWLFPKTYGTSVAIADTIFPQYFTARYPKFIKARVKQNFKWDPEMLEFYNGDPGKFKRCWKDVNQIYVPMNIKGSHWILCEVDFGAWMITAFDSDHTVSTVKEFEQALKPMAQMLPFYFLKCGLFDSRLDLALEENTLPVPFDIRRPLCDVVPQSKKSGDCGVYVIKHLECLLAQLPLTEVVDERMNFFRLKLCVDLFHHNLEP